MDSYDAGKPLRRLIPYPGDPDIIPSVAMSALLPGGYRGHESPASSVVAPAAAEKAASSIVSEAASILDEEMARGVLAARNTDQSHRDGRSGSNTNGLRQLHDLIDSIAEMWPSLPGAPGLPTALTRPTATNAAPASLPELQPRSPARPGERVVIPMTLCNKENRPVCLVPVATDLIGSRGERISCRQLQFEPGEIRLGPGEQAELTITTAVPPEAPGGCYAGLLVMTGVDYLRALLKIEVG